MDQIDPSLFAKTKRGKSGKAKDPEKQREIAALEAQVYRLTEILSEQRQATKENVQRKQARTAGEREDSDEEVSESEEEEEQETDVIYNPKNLPLGWDGKTDSLLALQTARTQHHIHVRDMRKRHLQGSQSFPKTLRRVASRARHALPGHTQYGTLRQCHSD